MTKVQTRDQIKVLETKVLERERSGLAELLNHPAVWRADAVTRPVQACPLSTGFPVLDDKLVERGWPRAGLVELLCAEPGKGELQLLVPALTELDRETSRLTIWIDPPFIPYAPALAELGLDLGRMLMIRTDVTDKGRRNALWSAELALRSGACSAVLSWLDEAKLKPRDVRRLKLAARQGGTLGVLFRPNGRDASMADLKIALESCNAVDHLELTVLKQRGGWPTGRFSITLSGASCSGNELSELLVRWRATRCVPETQADGDLTALQVDSRGDRLPYRVSQRDRRITSDLIRSRVFE